MEGRDHALSGLGVGLAVGIAQHRSIPVDFELAGWFGAFALLNDLDSCNSSAGRSLGFISHSVAWVIRGLSGGHRHGTHCLPGVAAFTALAIAACHYRGDWAGKAGLALLITIPVAGMLEALNLTGKHKHLGDLIGLAAAALVVFLGFGLALIPLAVAGGCATHLAGDGLTDEGVPLLLPLTEFRFRIPEPFAFSTGSDPETKFVRPALCVTIVVLALVALLPGPAHLLWSYTWRAI
jgi:membrane-bound metal-dependent hydrolase YbcI (DUF457 family)